MRYFNTKAVFIFLSIIFNDQSLSKGNMFAAKQFVHLHKNASVNSVVLVTLSCGQSVKLLNSTNEWVKIKSGSFKGFVLKRNLLASGPRCFSRTHSKLYNKLDLNMREVYKLGRLEDLFIYGEPSL